MLSFEPRKPCLGRDDERAALRELLAEPRALVQLTGEAGVGKTLLAQTLMDADTSRRWLYVSLDGADRQEVLERRIALARGEDAPAAPLAGLGGVTLVLDHADDLVHLAPVWLTCHLDALDADASVLWIARAPALPELPTLRLGPLDLETSAALLRASLPADLAHHMPDHEAEALCRALDGNPLAIELAARRLLLMPPHTLVERLRARQISPPAQGLFEGAWERLDGASRELLSVLSWRRGPFSLEEVHAALPGDVEATLVHLMSVGWVRGLPLPPTAPLTITSRRFELPELARRFAYARRQRDPALDARARRHHILTALSWLERWQARGEGVAWLPDALDDLFEAARLARGDQDEARIMALLEALMQRQGLTTQWSTLHHGASAPEITRSAAELMARADRFLSSGQPHAALRDLRAALDDEAAAPALRRDALWALGRLLRRLNQSEGAIDAYQRALDDALLIGDEARQLKASLYLGHLCMRADREDDASAHFARLVNMIEAHPELDPAHEHELRAVITLADLAVRRGELAEAVVWCERGLRRAPLIGDTRAEGILRGRLGQVALELGDAALAIRHLDRALADLPEAEHIRRITARLDRAQVALERDEDARAHDLLDASPDALPEPLRPRAALLRAWAARLSVPPSPSRGELARAAAQAARGRRDHAVEHLALALLPDPEASPLDAAEQIALHQRAAEAMRPPAPWLLVSLELLHACARLRSDAARPDEVFTLWDTWRARLEEIGLDSPEHDPRGLTDATTRLAVRALGQALRALGHLSDEAPLADATAQTGCLRVAEDLGWFACPEQAPVPLTRKRLLQRLLGALVDARQATPGQPVPVDTLLAAGWPDEPHMLHSAAMNRLHVALNRMRQMGLDDVLQRVDDGYLLDPAVGLRREP